MENIPLLQELLAHLHPEKDNAQKIDREAYPLLQTFTSNNLDVGITELVYSLTVDYNDIKKIACLIDMLIWLSPANENTTAADMVDWLFCSTQRKIEIVLNLEEGFPLYQKQQLKERLEAIKMKFKNLAGLCDHQLATMEHKQGWFTLQLGNRLTK